MNGGLWPTKCSSGWSPSTTAAAESSVPPPQPPIQPRSQHLQAQMEINPLYPVRNLISQEPPPIFNNVNMVHGEPGPAEMRDSALSLLSGNYPHFHMDKPNYNNALQSFSFPFSGARPISGNQITEIQNRILQSRFCKPNPPMQVNVGNAQSGYKVQSLDFRGPQKLLLNGKVASRIGDQRLVFCMNTVGEIFVVESRYLGIICFCHKLKMSVAKFCEHSGANSSKAGESVYMENGMTISQWTKYFLGVESIRWDWQNESPGPASSENNNNSIFKTPSQAFQTKNNFNGYNSSNNNNNNNNNIPLSLNPNPNLSMQRGQISTDLFKGVTDRPNLVQKGVNYGNINWNRENNNSSSLIFGKGPSYGNNTSNSSSRFENGISHGNSTSNSENNNSPSIRFEKGANCGNSIEYNLSSSSSSRSEIGINYGNRENNNSNSSSSRFELKLGQPSNINSNNNNSMRGEIPNRMQLGTVFDARTNQPYQPLVNRDLSTRETPKPSQNPQKEDLQFPRNPNTINSNSNSNSNPTNDEFAPDSMKNSLISLFLSHLERKNPTESSDDIFGNNNNSNNDSFRGLDEKSSSYLDQRTLNTNLGSNLNFSRFCANDGGPVCNFTQNFSGLRQHGFQPVMDLSDKPENHMKFCEKVPQHGRMCCLSNLNKNQNSSHEELVHESRCNNHRSIPQCLACMSEKFNCRTYDGTDKLSCVSNTNTDNIEIEKSQNKCAISSLEDEQHRNTDTNPNPNLWKDVPRKDFQEENSIREKEISSISSGSSNPAITESSLLTGTTTGPVPVLTDEASGVEKCGSSDEQNDFEFLPSMNSINSLDLAKRKHGLVRTNKPVKRLRKEKLVNLVHHGPDSHSDPDELPTDNRDCNESETNKIIAKKRKERFVDLVHHGPVSEIQETFSEKKKEVDSVHHGPMNRTYGKKLPKYKYLSCIETEERETKSENDDSLGVRRNKPIVCGDFGIISNGLTDDLPNHNVKIVSLSSVLRRIEKGIFDKSSQIEVEKNICELERSNGPFGNSLKKEQKSFKRNVFGESSRRIKKGRKKSISLDVMEEKEMDTFESSLINTELDQEALNNQVSGPSQGIETRRNEGQERHLVPNSGCSVCRSSKEEDLNIILQCKQCSIKVHQACYGVSSVPKTGWFCRPCKTNSFGPVCVLCGYKGGAMTRAMKPQKLINSLLKYVKFENNLGFDERSTTHWIHMVCGLWTPGTRCPNVGTMGSFDVSGASLSRKNTVCSICKRQGGSCIVCRVSDCSVVFHPWCAHKKGLLQNEAEGDHSESVGFYGTCIYHAMLNNLNGDNNNNFEIRDEEYELNEEWTCARTEGFKGRKKEQGLSPDYNKLVRKNGIVSQEQINAWSRINGSKPFGIGTNGIERPLSSDVELDFRKEYIRYKQTKGWKKLILYKSGIHALGLYTSCFIPHGALVVEYVGEIVGQKVADKREKEYQLVQRLHSKSACYFFRIDKDHIIDATKKGGIARFVNHSCSPNCVAKIISIKNEKKVVFFAEREINPGEEITYDYHFNREDEGEKIPCFCNSKNCRRYLN